MLYNSAVVLVVDENGANMGQMSFKDAQRLAEERNLDLVELSKTGSLPVCKIMDKGKWEYAKKKKKQVSHVHHSAKEVNFRVSTETHDLKIKVLQINKFLSKGLDVKIAVNMRGREKGNVNMAREKLNTIISEIGPETIRQDSILSSPSSVSVTIHPLSIKKSNASTNQTV